MSNITKYILVLITALAISVFHHSFSFAETYNTYPYGYTDTQIDTNQKISKIFDNLETTGKAFNSGGSNAVTGVLLDTGCRDAIDYIMKTNLFHDIKEDITLPKIENSIYRKYLSGRLDGFGQNSINQLSAFWYSINHSNSISEAIIFRFESSKKFMVLFSRYCCIKNRYFFWC